MPSHQAQPTNELDALISGLQNYAASDSVN